MKSQSKKYKPLGQYLKVARLESNMKQAFVSKKLGVCTQYVSNFELGKCHIPLKYLKKMVHLYKLSTQETIDLILAQEAKKLETALAAKK